MLPAIGAVRPWADPHLISINRLPMRPPTTALRRSRRGQGGRHRSPWRRSLDGRWRFRLFDHPDVIPAAAVERPADGPDVDDGRGPGQLDAAGRRRPPAVHQRADAVPRPAAAPARSQPDRRVPPHDAGPEAAGSAGRSCSTSVAPRASTRSTSTASSSATAPTAGWPANTTSRRTSTPAPTTSRSSSTRWSAHSYVEDQDQWWMAGLHRSVYVEARAAVHVALAGVRCRAARRWHARTQSARSWRAPRSTARTPRGPGWQVRFGVETLRGRRRRPARRPSWYRIGSPRPICSGRTRRRRRSSSPASRRGRPSRRRVTG